MGEVQREEGGDFNQGGVTSTVLSLGSGGCVAQSDASGGMQCHVRRRRPGRVLEEKKQAPVL